MTRLHSLITSVLTLTLLALSPVAAAESDDKEAQAKESHELIAAAPDAAVPLPIRPADTGALAERVAAAEASKPKTFRYSRKGAEIGGKDRFFYSKINVRSQLRFSSPFQSAPRKESHFAAEGENDFRFQRARFKAEGHFAKPWIEYKYEHDLVDGRQLDARVTISKLKWLQFQFGQWKADFSRERIDSSGKQQFADRSIVNRAFTVDRQKGVMLLGRVMEDSPFDSEYYVGAFTGNGRGFLSDRFDLDHGDGKPMWVMRYQWNPLNGGVGHSQSDLEYTEKPALSFATATVSNRSRYTRFSSSGGGQLDGFSLGDPGQYALRQYLGETALKYRGLAVQHETHWKRVTDTKTLRVVDMRGSYVQAGYFFHHILNWVPRQLELGGRYAFVDPNNAKGSDLQKELSFVVNWFFYGHNNKLTFDTSRYSLGQGSMPALKDTQVRMQWDVSF